MDGGLLFAFDKDTARSFGVDGHMHVAVSNISKAAVNPYVGHEIPDWEKLGLERNKIYKLFRDPDELAKAAPTFNNLPLLSKHVAISADAHPSELVIGSTGTDAVFEAPYLRNSLVIWPKGAINLVETDEQKELSSAYRYRADMTPGEFQGQKYDGVMRDIVGNHVALVKEGRAGADVVVGDSNQEIIAMSKKVLLSRTALLTLGTLAAATAPLLAQDHKLPDLVPIVADVTSKNFKDSKPKVMAALAKALEGKLAKDASIDEVAKLLDVLDSHNVQADAEAGAGAATEANAAGIGIMPDGEEATDADPLQAIKDYLKAKGVADEIIAALPAGGATDEPPPFKGMPKVGGGTAKDADPDKDDEDEDKVTKAAMDAAITAAVQKAHKDAAAIRDAERAIRPHVGELAVAYDSADKVYEAALKMLGVKTDGVHPSAFPTILAMQPKASDKKPRVALDHASVDAKDFNTRWGDLPPVQAL